MVLGMVWKRDLGIVHKPEWRKRLFFFFAFQDVQGTALTSVGPLLLDSEQGLGLRVGLPKNWPKPWAP